MQRVKMLGIVLTGLACASGVAGSEKPLDFWDESHRLFTTVNSGQSLYHDLSDGHVKKHSYQETINGRNNWKVKTTDW